MTHVTKGENGYSGEELGTALDRVCGMEVETQDNPYTTEYKAKTYYFCSQNCREQFDVEPQMYVDTDEPSLT